MGVLGSPLAIVNNAGFVPAAFTTGPTELVQSNPNIKVNPSKKGYVVFHSQMLMLGRVLG
jgi:hypothetical protein